MDEILDVGGDGVAPLVILAVLIPVVIGSILCWLLGTKFQISRPNDRRVLRPFLYPEGKEFPHPILRRIIAAFIGVAVGIGLFLPLWTMVGADFSRIELGNSVAIMHFPFRRDTLTFERVTIEARAEEDLEDHTARLVIEDRWNHSCQSYPVEKSAARSLIRKIELWRQSR